MSNTFEIKRFWNYLKFDLTTARNDSGVTFAILGAMPAFWYFIAQAFALLFNGHTVEFGDVAKIMAFGTAIVIGIIFFPARHYGPVTDKKQGSDWLMLPASRLEKWLSMLIVTCLAVPAFLCAELAATDGLMSLLFNGTYGSTALKAISGGMNMFWGELSTDAGRIAICWPYAFYLSWCENNLFFTLGAIWFKKNKIGMTFITAFLLGMVLSMLSIVVFKTLGIPTSFEASDMSEEGVLRIINVTLYAVYILYFAVLDVLLYLRVKTIKH